MNNSTNSVSQDSGRGTNYEWRTVGVHALRAQGVNTVFGYPGGAICRFTMHCMTVAWNTCCADTRRCSNGGYRLCPCYRQNWRMFATSGPGATNLITGLADALLIPSLLLPSPVRYPHRLSALTISGSGCTGIVISLYQAQLSVQSLEELPRIMAEAFDAASSVVLVRFWSISQKISS